MMQVNRFTLDNGLRVIHNQDTSTAMVAVNVLYDVGARDESPELTGLAHLFEHLMFGGSVNIPDFDAPLQKAGGMSNAWTSNDFTNFYDVIPAHNVETAFWLESDRMLSLAFNPHALEVQRSVVIEEFKQQCLNRPYGDMGHHIRALSYRTHPYRYPVIGRDISDIERVSDDDVRQFYYAHYAPGNAILSVCGNVSFDRVRELAQRWFAPIARRNVAARVHPVEPVQTSTRYAEASGCVPNTAIAITYHMDGYGTKQYFAADLLTDLLANGSSSRFYRRLALGTDMFAEVDASILGSEEPGLLMINAKLHRGGEADIERAVNAIKTELDEMVTTEVTDYELTRAVNRMESAAMFANLNYLGRAQLLAMTEYHGEDVNHLIDPYRALTPADIRETAADIIDHSRCSTFIYHPA